MSKMSFEKRFFLFYFIRLIQSNNFIFHVFVSAESDICTFSLRTVHFISSHPLTTGLFTSASRPKPLQKLYESAAPTPVHTIRQLDQFRRDGTRSSKYFVCTPILSRKKKKCKKIDLEIETRKVRGILKNTTDFFCKVALSLLRIRSFCSIVEISLTFEKSIFRKKKKKEEVKSAKEAGSLLVFKSLQLSAFLKGLHSANIFFGCVFIQTLSLWLYRVLLTLSTHLCLVFLPDLPIATLRTVRSSRIKAECLVYLKLCGFQLCHTGHNGHEFLYS